MDAHDFILSYYAIGAVLFISSAILFYQVYGLLPLLILHYEIPYPLKRTLLCIGIGGTFFRAYLALLGVLFKNEKFYYGHVSRWKLKVDEAKKVRDTVTAVPSWVSIILLYFLTIVISLL